MPNRSLRNMKLPRRFQIIGGKKINPKTWGLSTGDAETYSPKGKAAMLLCCYVDVTVYTRMYCIAALPCP